jgi:hypothetical protein
MEPLAVIAVLNRYLLSEKVVLSAGEMADVPSP